MALTTVLWRTSTTPVQTDMETDDGRPDGKVATITVVIHVGIINLLFMASLYLRGHTIQEVGGNRMMIGSSIYGVAVIDELLCSRFYGICVF